MWKAAVIGLGKIGLMYDFEPGRKRPSSHAGAYHLHEDFDLVMAADPSIERKAFLNELAPETVYLSDVEQGLLHMHPNVVSVCTPPQFHLEQIKMLLSLNEPPSVIFCEKPLANNLAEAYKISSLCKEAIYTVLVPNISRRWNSGMNRVTASIRGGEYGALEKIHIRYTRGIYNTGAHLFDLLHMWTGSEIAEVKTLKLVHTSSELEGEPSYTFFFEQKDGIWGYAEAMDDEHYYLFEIDLYLTGGKIEMRFSGDEVFYYSTNKHHLFAGYDELHLVKHERHILSESMLENAISNLSEVLSGNAKPACRIEDAIYPLHVASAIEKSYRSGKKEQVTKNE